MARTTHFRYTLTDSHNRDKEEIRQKLQQEVEAWEAAGNKIKRIPSDMPLRDVGQRLSIKPEFEE